MDDITPGRFVAEDVGWFTDIGEPPHSIARTLGYDSPDHLAACLDQLGYPSLARRIRKDTP